MLSRSNWLILILAIVASVIGGYVQHRDQQPVTDTTLIGRPAPDISLPDLDGQPHRLADYRSRRVVLNFWASECGPCLDEMPALNRAQKKFGERGSLVVGIAMDGPLQVRAFLAAHPMNYPILLGQFTTPSTSLQLGDIREVLPYSVLIDAAGQVEATHVGALSAVQLEQWLAPVPQKP
ncbi:MAG TPA: TlpA disulfide reductase family protein [Rhodanobacter sp.]